MNKILITTLILVSLLSCKQKTDSTSMAHSEDTSLSMNLNNGEKWVVNDEMKPFITESERLVEDYSALNDADYQTLAKALITQNGKLIKSCTMTGQGHDELHVWLNPYIEYIYALKEAKNVDEADNVLKQIKHSYSIYHKHFQ